MRWQWEFVTSWEDLETIQLPGINQAVLETGHAGRDSGIRLDLIFSKT